MPTCPNCGANVAATAAACPNCRADLGQQGTAGAAGTAGSGISRRALLAGGGALALAAAGVVAYTQLGGGPQATARKLVEAMDRGDYLAAQALWHPRSPESISRYQVDQMASQDVSVVSMTLISRSQSEALVRVELRIREGTTSRTQNAVFTLRKYRGEWRVYSTS